MRVAVYGNLILDLIVTLRGPLVPGASHVVECIKRRWGGIANFCRANTGLQTIAVSTVNHSSHAEAMAELSVYCEPDLYQNAGPTTTAIVLADLASNARTGLVSWGTCSTTDNWSPVSDATAHHLMYLDRMNINATQMEEFGNARGLVTADLCDSSRALECGYALRYIDYLFCSEMEPVMLKSVMAIVRRGVIMHSPSSSMLVTSDGVISSVSVQTEKILNVVGAGDYFAAFCVAGLINGRLDLLRAHELTGEMLRKQT